MLPRATSILTAWAVLLHAAAGCCAHHAHASKTDVNREAARRGAACCHTAHGEQLEGRRLPVEQWQLGGIEAQGEWQGPWRATGRAPSVPQHCQQGACRALSGSRSNGSGWNAGQEDPLPGPAWAIHWPRTAEPAAPAGWQGAQRPALVLWSEHLQASLQVWRL